MAKTRTSTRKDKVRQQRRRQKQLKRNLSIGIVAIVVIALVIVVWPKPQPKPLPEGRLGADPALGASNAQVTIIEYGDFGCSSCKVWYQDGVMQKIMAQYGDKVQFVC